MKIHDELYRIAAANYGLQMKDPVFSAFDKLSEDTKFELLKDFLNDDYAEFNNTMTSYYTDNTTCKTIRNIFDLLLVLNGRKGYFAKSVSGTGHYDENRIHIWIDMLAKELVNSGTGVLSDGVCCKGNGITNGSKIRAAVYNILDILQYSNSVTFDNPVVDGTSPYCILGGLQGVKVYDAPSTFYLEVTNLFNSDKEVIYVTESEYTFDNELPYSLYQVRVAEDEDCEHILNAEVQISYNALRPVVTPKIEDYTYELYGQHNLKARVLSYIGTDVRVAIPDTFETGTLTEIAIGAFTGTNVESVYIPDGVYEIL